MTTMPPPAWLLLAAAPLLEEAVFRAGLQEALLHRLPASVHTVNALVALTFALTHVALRQDTAAFAVLLPALAVGAVYQHTRRLRLCVALHAAMNAAWLAWQLLPISPTGA